MSENIKIILGGVGGLIALYLLVKNGGGFAQVVNSTGSVLVNESKTLQGR